MFHKLIIFTIFIVLLDATFSENVRKVLFRDEPGPCGRNEFPCLNGQCIPRRKQCDSHQDCTDNSDENYCTGNSCPREYSFRCRTRNGYNYKCIPSYWRCDGIKDCLYSNEDETNCATKSKTFKSHVDLTADHVHTSKVKGESWLLSQREGGRIMQKWGSDVPKIAIALYLAQHSTFVEKEGHLHEIAYELSSSLHCKIISKPKLALKKMDAIRTSELASYVNAFLVACIDPRKFYVLDLVQELRKRVDSGDTTSPYAFLALCNAQDTITNEDVQKLLDVYSKAQREFRTDIQAIAIMALSCAARQPQKIFDEENLSELILDLKGKQSRNGTVENLKTTALIMQALFAAEPKNDEENYDEENFDERKAIYQIIRSQDEQGSFGSLAHTYYALPVLNQMSLVNISSGHCPEFHRNEKETLQQLNNQLGEKCYVKYSTLIGENKIFQRTITLHVPKNTSFYGVMEYAADLDDKYRYEYNVRNRKPFVYSLSGLMDDPESETFWSLHQLVDETKMELTPIDKSPVDVVPKDQNHFVYWYKKDATY